MAGAGAGEAWTTVGTPCGEMLLTAERAGLTRAWFPPYDLPAGPADPDHPVLEIAASELAEYFAGTRTAFTVPLAPRGSAFQRQVWDALRQIPYGETATYTEVARRVGVPTATRAVGSANGSNPIAVIVPCHRVVGSDGRVRGYAGGVERKVALLELERALDRDTLFWTRP